MFTLLPFCKNLALYLLFKKEKYRIETIFILNYKLATQFEIISKHK